MTIDAKELAALLRQHVRPEEAEKPFTYADFIATLDLYALERENELIEADQRAFISQVESAGYHTDEFPIT